MDYILVFRYPCDCLVPVVYCLLYNKCCAIYGKCCTLRSHINTHSQRDHFPCIAHTLQLAVNKGLKVARVQRIIARCKAIVSHFKRSTKETYKLREKQELLKLSQQLVQDCVTRWGSTLSMLQRLVDNKRLFQQCWWKGRTGI